MISKTTTPWKFNSSPPGIFYHPKKGKVVVEILIFQEKAVKIREVNLQNVLKSRIYSKMIIWLVFSNMFLIFTSIFGEMIQLDDMICPTPWSLPTPWALRRLGKAVMRSNGVVPWSCCQSCFQDMATTCTWSCTWSCGCCWLLVVGC